MAKAQKRVIWTVCYAVYDEERVEDVWTDTWFAYGTTAEEAKEDFRKYWEREKQNFCIPPNYTDMAIVNVRKGFSF